MFHQILELMPVAACLLNWFSTEQLGLKKKHVKTCPRLLKSPGFLERAETENVELLREVEEMREVLEAHHLDKAEGKKSSESIA